MRVQPGARRTGFVGWFGELPKLAVAASPVDGAANDAVLTAIAHAFGRRPREVVLVGGAQSRTKRFEIAGMTEEEIGRRLTELMPR